MPWLYAFFFVSGFCCILYELVWLRLAMARFGVTTALVATFLSLFMGGLGLGSWAAGQLIRKHCRRISFPPIRLYALVELLIGISAVVVPRQLFWGHHLLLRMGNRVALSSTVNYALSGLWLLATLVPWCACMGATFPLALLAMNGNNPDRRSFSYLYLANVLGAMAGAVFPLLMIEERGFSGTLWAGATLNTFIAAGAFLLSRSSGFAEVPGQQAEGKDLARTPLSQQNSSRVKWFLFATGLSSMGMEVVWIRMFTPYLGTVVYSFAAILAIYLLATFLGTRIYRKWRAMESAAAGVVWFMLGTSGLLPLLAADPSLHIGRLLRLPLGVALVAAIAGFVTPMLIDEESQGDPQSAGSAYAVNVLGCVAGPLIAGYLLLPYLGERWSLAALTAPWFAIGMISQLSGRSAEHPLPVFRMTLVPAGFLLTGCLLFLGTKGYEEQFPDARVLRDPAATVIATGSGLEKQMLINGIGMTKLSPITKMMAHLPLAFADHPSRVLIICFGMGTTHRSVLSWGIHSTAVELVPSVPKLFSYYHDDAARLLQLPQSEVIIDDGRHYLEWSREEYDVITVDPPPPVNAAASSLLYSREFYDIAKEHLGPGGVLQQWLPGGDAATIAGVARALKESFAYVRIFPSVKALGVHFLVSTRPLHYRSASELAERLPPAAVNDMLEWGPAATAVQQFDLMLRKELAMEQLLAVAPQTPAIRDDRPINEYFLLREGIR